MRFAGLILACTLIAIGTARGQQPLFSTFGPGESFTESPGLSIGAGEMWNLTGNNGAISAAAFTPNATFPFSHADFALGYAVVPYKDLTGPSDIDVTLTADDGGRPGDTLETIHIKNAFGGSTVPAVLTATSLLQPMLEKGFQYWLVLAPPDLLHTIFEWGIGPASAPNSLPVGQFLVLNTGTEPWWSPARFSVGSPAFAVFGANKPDSLLPAVAANGIVSAADYSTPVSAGSWIAIFGDNLSPTTRGWNAGDFSGTALPVSLDGVSVLVNGMNAAVSYVSPGQVNAQVPDLNPYSISFTLQVIGPAGASAPVNLPNASFAPALFSLAQSGVSYAAATHADGTPISPGSPANPGETIALYGTGFGPSNPTVPSGTIVTSPEPLADIASVAITIGGLVAPVTYAGITEAGLDQINVTVPQLPPGTYSIQVVPETTTAIQLPVGAQ